jgi:hypothetical protein
MTTTIVNIGRGLCLTPVELLHNLDEFGMDIQLAIDAWMPRRHNLTARMFCNYIRQRDPKFICLPLEEAKLISNTLKHIS